MKRYLIFAALGPLLGGFLLLFATTYMSGYWTQTDLAEVKKLFVVFAQDAAIQLSVRHPADADDGGGRTISFSTSSAFGRLCGC